MTHASSMPVRAVFRSVIVAVVTLLLVALIPANAQAAELAPGWRHEMLARVNAVRASVGVPALHPCGALRRSAQEYAMVMASTSTFGHVGQDGSEPWTRMTRQGYTWRVAAENIAAGQATIEQVVQDWVLSPEHYANLINPSLRHVGFGYSSDPTSTYGSYWVQNFGSGRGC
jgi:uncharacterized protein YkwD